MKNLQTLTENYLEYCRTQKCLDEKTLREHIGLTCDNFLRNHLFKKITEITPNNRQKCPSHHAYRFCYSGSRPSYIMLSSP